MKSRGGFTLVEILVVLVVVGILATIVSLSYTRVQRDGRDSERAAKASVIADALENYYNQNGEYPSVISLVNTEVANTGSVVATKLGITKDILVFPLSPSTVTNSISTTHTAKYHISYVASHSTNNTACQTSTTGGCEEFTLSYTPETGSVITIDSRRSGAPVIP